MHPKPWALIYPTGHRYQTGDSQFGWAVSNWSIIATMTFYKGIGIHHYRVFKTRARWVIWMRLDSNRQLASHKEAFQSILGYQWPCWVSRFLTRTGPALTGPPPSSPPPIQGSPRDCLADNVSELRVEPVGNDSQKEKARYRKARVQQAITGTLWAPHGPRQPMVGISAIPGSLQSAVVSALDLSISRRIIGQKETMWIK